MDLPDSRTMLSLGAEEQWRPLCRATVCPALISLPWVQLPPMGRWRIDRLQWCGSHTVVPTQCSLHTESLACMKDMCTIAKARRRFLGRCKYSTVSKTTGNGNRYESWIQNHKPMLSNRIIVAKDDNVAYTSFPPI